MRISSLLFFIVILSACTGTKPASVSKRLMDGTWIPVSQEIGGTALPAAVYEKQKLVVDDSLYTLTAESVDKGIVRYSNGEMDIYGKEGVNAGKHFTAIYKYEDGKLTICYNLKGDGYPADFSTQGQPLYFLSVFKRE